MPVVTPDLLSKFPFLTLPDGRLVSMLDEQLTGAPRLPPQLRQIAIQRLGDYLEEAYAVSQSSESLTSFIQQRLPSSLRTQSWIMQAKE